MGANIDTSKQPTVEQLEAVDKLVAAERALEGMRAGLQAWDNAVQAAERHAHPTDVFAAGRDIGRVIESFSAAEDGIFDAMNAANAYIHDPVAAEYLRRRREARNG